MVIYHKNLNEILLGTKKPLKYSEEFTFIPLRIYNDNSYKECIFQTPKLFLPYGKQRLNNGKYVIDLSFQNKGNDENNVNFLNSLKKIFSIIKDKYNKYNVNSFLKETAYDYTMRLKISSESKFYDNLKNHLYKTDSFCYGIFIICLEGIWMHNKEIWFQWHLLQARIEKPSFLNEYAFIEESKEKDKYTKMRNMGVPEGAIELQKSIDNKKNSIPIPPPIPQSLPSFKKSNPVSKIKSSDLQSIILKKTKPLERKKINSNIGFEPPSVEELQTTLFKLKKIKSN